MRYITLLCFVLCCSVSFPCLAQDKPEYNIRPDVAEEDKKLFIERAEKGKILYKIHCTDCHGIYTKGKDSIPNFTKQQIDDYQARSVMGFKSHTSVRKLSYEQLDYILTFLRLRKVDK